jgi:hypothetical protein
MATKKKVRKKKSAGKKRASARVKKAGKKKVSRPKKALRRKNPSQRLRLSRAEAAFDRDSSPSRRGLGEDAAGQSGDTQGLSRAEDADSESVEELLEEGQAFEAEAVSGVENALDPDQGEVRTTEVPEDDVHPEDDDQD